MNISNRLSNINESLFRRHFFLFFALVFYTSWVYEITALSPATAAILPLGKNILVLSFMLLMAAEVRWKDVEFDAFAGLCLAWLILCVLLWVDYHDPMQTYLRRIGQVFFAYVFITFLRQNPELNPCFGDGIKKWFSPLIVSMAVLVIVILTLTTRLAVDVGSGFGNSRVNFSIWLTQIVALILIVNLTGRKSNAATLIVCLLLITPVYILQNLTGGRSGLLGAFILVSLIVYRWGGVRAAAVSVVWLYLISLMVANYNPLIIPANNLYVFRNIEYSSSSSVGDFVAWLDRFSSYRVSILITAFSTLDLRGLWFGVGLGNFVGWAPTYPELGTMEVHNVFLKILGEYGVLGFLVFLAISLLPTAHRNETEVHRSAKLVQFCCLIVAMIQPDLMLTAINLSFVYLAGYAVSIGSPRWSRSKHV